MDTWFNIFPILNHEKNDDILDLSPKMINRAFLFSPIKATMDARFYNEKVKKSIICNYKKNQYFHPDSFHTTLLGIAVEAKNLDVIDKLLKKGANANGINDIGLSFYAPLTTINISKEIIKKLMLYGADINFININEKNPLINQLLFTQDEDMIEFILSKGINPNHFYNRFDLPLTIIINKIVNGKVHFSLGKRIINLLLYYNVNPYIENKNNKTTMDFCTNFLKNCKNKIKVKKMNEIISIINCNITDISEESKNILLIKKLAKAYKIKYKNLKNKSYRKLLCQKINEAKFNKKYNKKHNCLNHQILSFDEITCFSEDEIYYYIDEKNNKWGFHISEIPYILLSQKNPWNNEIIPINNLENMFDHLDYFPIFTLENILLKFNNYTYINYSNKHQISHLSTILNSYHPYINIEYLINLNILLLKEFFMLIDPYIYLITPQKTISDITNYIESGNKEKVISCIISYLYDMLQGINTRSGNPIPISLISHIIIQLYNDINTIKDIKLQFGDELFNIYFTYLLECPYDSLPNIMDNNLFLIIKNSLKNIDNSSNLNHNFKSIQFILQRYPFPDIY